MDAILLVLVLLGVAVAFCLGVVTGEHCQRKDHVNLIRELREARMRLIAARRRELMDARPQAKETESVEES